MDWCEHCQKEVYASIEDHGIGRGEAWGVPFNDVRKVAVCSECREPLESTSAEEIEHNLACERADAEYDRRKDEQLERQWEEENGKA